MVSPAPPLAALARRTAVTRVPGSSRSYTVTRVYYYSKKNVDVNLKYKWHPRLTLFVDVINVFDDPIANAFVP